MEEIGDGGYFIMEQGLQKLQLRRTKGREEKVQSGMEGNRSDSEETQLLWGSPLGH